MSTTGSGPSGTGTRGYRLYRTPAWSPWPGLNSQEREPSVDLRPLPPHRQPALHHPPFVRERQKCRRLGRTHPTRFVDLVIMVGDVARTVLEQEEVYPFVISHPLATMRGDVPVFDHVDRGDDVGLDACLLANLPGGRLFRRFAFLNESLRQLPAMLRAD